MSGSESSWAGFYGITRVQEYEGAHDEGNVCDWGTISCDGVNHSGTFTGDVTDAEAEDNGMSRLLYR